MMDSPSLKTSPTWSRRLRGLLDHPLFTLPRDFPLFLKGAHTDAAIKRTRQVSGSRKAFELIYTSSPDPWASASSRYRYQKRKYEQILSVLPGNRFRKALDLGCGLGLLSQLLAVRADSVIGIDFADAALTLARERAARMDNLSFVQGDILDLDPALNGQFDIIVIADVIYYLSPLNEEALKNLSIRLAKLLSPELDFGHFAKAR